MSRKYYYGAEHAKGFSEIKKTKNICDIHGLGLHLTELD
jgi:hypothetical protein